MSSGDDKGRKTPGNPDSSGQLEQRRGWTAKRITIGVVVALIALFALLNTRSVEVSWIFGSPVKTPLIVVIAISGLIGAGIGYLYRGRG